MSEEDKKKEFKNAISHLRMVLKTYDSTRYSVKILVANKECWIKKVEDAHASAINVMLEIQDFEFTTDEEKAEMTKSIEEQEEKIIEYVTNINNKILENDGAAAEVPVSNRRIEFVSAETKAVKEARINIDIDADKISEEVKQLQVQI